MSLLNTKVTPKLTEGSHQFTIVAFKEVECKTKDGADTSYVELTTEEGENNIPYKFNLFENSFNIVVRELEQLYFPGEYITAGEILEGMLGKTVEGFISYVPGNDGRMFQNLNFRPQTLPTGGAQELPLN